jgi:hypothetical protein
VAPSCLFSETPAPGSRLRPTLRRCPPCSRLRRQPHPHPHPPLCPLRRLRPRTTHMRRRGRGRGRRMGIMRTLCTMQPLALPRGRNPSRPRPRRPGRTARRRLRHRRRTPALETLRSGMRARARARARCRRWPTPATESARSGVRARELAHTQTRMQARSRPHPRADERGRPRYLAGPRECQRRHPS